MVQLSVVAWIYIATQAVVAIVCSIASLHSIGTKEQPSKELQEMSCSKMFRLWMKTTWKMRNIYSSFAVHVFDFTTDLLVITEWYNAENGKNNTVDHIDSRLMAWSSIGILIFYKIISTIAVYLTTKSAVRALAQFLDLLLFEDIYIAHQRVVTQVKNKNDTINVSHGEGNTNENRTESDINDNKESNINEQVLDVVVSSSTSVTNSMEIVNDKSMMMDEINKYFVNKNKKLLLSKGIDNKAIESTMRFKYIRSLEALFESTPQAVLQLVYLMRTGEIDNTNQQIIIIISLFQSILSMTNSILASDNAYMARDKFKDDKKRLPPSIPFLKHFVVRLSEISYRVGLFALFWTVVGGQWFAVLLGFEMLWPVFWGGLQVHDGTFEWEEVFLTLNMVCIIIINSNN